MENDQIRKNLKQYFTVGRNKIYRNTMDLEKSRRNFNHSVDYSIDNNSCNCVNKYSFRNLTLIHKKRRNSSNAKIIPNLKFNGPNNKYNLKSLQSFDKPLRRSNSLPNYNNDNNNDFNSNYNNNMYNYFHNNINNITSTPYFLCTNCFGREFYQKNKKDNDKNKDNRSCSSTSMNFNHHFELINKIDSDYFNSRILRNETKQKMAFNNLDMLNKKGNDKKLLQYINEFDDNPLLFNNLQDRGFYKNKEKYDNINNYIKNNKSMYNFHQPRKAIYDYYEKNQFDIPLLENYFRPCERYKKKYLETLRNQIFQKKYENYLQRKNAHDDIMNEKKNYEKFLTKKFDDDYYFNKDKKSLYDNFNNDLTRGKNIDAQMENNDIKYGLYEKNSKILMGDENYRRKKNEEKMNDIRNFKEWYTLQQKENQRKKMEDEKNNERIKNLNLRLNNKFKNDLEAYRCSECNMEKPLDKLIEFPIFPNRKKGYYNKNINYEDFLTNSSSKKGK